MACTSLMLSVCVPCTLAVSRALCMETRFEAVTPEMPAMAKVLSVGAVPPLFCA